MEHLTKLPEGFGPKTYDFLGQAPAMLPDTLSNSGTEHILTDGQTLVRWVTRYEGRRWNRLEFRRK